MAVRLAHFTNDSGDEYIALFTDGQEEPEDFLEDGYEFKGLFELEVIDGSDHQLPTGSLLKEW